MPNAPSKPEPTPPPLARAEDPGKREPRPRPRQPEPDRQIEPGSPERGSPARIVFDEDEVP